MPNGDNEKLFGSSKEQVSAKIIELESERKSLADKGKLSRKENKRFSALDDIIAQGNKYRSTFEGVPGQESGGTKFEVDKASVVGRSPEGFNPDGTKKLTRDELINEGVPEKDIPAGAPIFSAGTDIQPITGTPVSTIPSQANQGSIPNIDLGGGGEQGAVVPINEGIEDPSNKIVQETVAGIQRTDDGTGGVDQEISKATFGGSAGGYPSIKKPGEAMATLDSTTSLGINDPILKGNVGGQIIGSQPVFVGGGDFLAMHAINNRKKAIQDQAIQREEDKRALIAQKPPIVKDQRFQRSLNNQFFGSINSTVDKAKEVYGEDWDLAIKDQSNPLGREFVQSLANFDFIAGQADQVTDLVGEIDADLESGDQVFSDETLQLRDEYNQLQNDFSNGEIGGIVSLSDKFNKLKGFTNLDKIIKDNDIDTKGKTTQYASILEDDEKYVTTTQKKVAYEEYLHTLATGLANNQMRDAVRNGYISEDEIFERLNARYGYENIISKKITTKPKGGGVSVTVDVNSAEEGDEDQQIGEGDNKEIFESPYGFPVSSKVKPFKVSGIQIYDANGNTSHLANINEVKVNRIQVNRFLDKDGNVIYKKVAVAEVTENVPILKSNGEQLKTKGVLQFEENKVTRMISLDVPGVQAQIKTDAVDNFDELNANMDEWIANQGTGEKTNTEDALEILNQ